jgi:autotransporter-associated beta strand protein
VRVTAAPVVYGNAPTYTVTAQYLPPVSVDPSQTPVNLTPVNNGLITVRDGAGGLAEFAISAANTTAADFSSTGYLAAGSYNLEPSAVRIVVRNFNAMTLVGSLNVTPKQISAGALGVTGITKVYDGSAAISMSDLNYTASPTGVNAGDSVTVSATGRFVDSDGNANANVGTNKFVDVALALAGVDARNYSLSTTQLSDDLSGTGSGSVTQLASVTWVGPSANGYWSNASNWAGGAIPNYNNVAQVIIPTGANVIYDSALVGVIGSTIVNNGTITFSGSNDFDLANVVSGSGGLNQSGAGLLTVSGNNTFAGVININASRLLLAHANAFGTSNSITSNGGNLALANGVDLPQLTVNGAVTLSSDIRTVGTQTYNGAVSLAGGVDTLDAYYVPPQTLKLITLSSDNANITFNGTLDAGATSLTDKRSLIVDAGTARVTFNDRVGSVNGTYGDFLNRTADLSPYQLEVLAGSILINADITTFERQVYRGDVLIGDNGTNGLTRILLSEDPSIQFFGKVDDVLANTHGLLAKAVSIYGNETPDITFFADVGSVAALASLDVELGQQNQDINIAFSDISINDRTQYIGNLTIAGNVSTSGNQTYTANVIKVGDASVTSSSVPNTVKMTSTGGSVTFNTGVNGGVQGAGLNPSLEVLHGDTGNASGLTNAINLTVTTGLYNPPPIPLPENEASANYDGAAFFSSLVKQSVDRSSSNPLADEVVEVGEVGLLENGVLKRIDSDLPCDPKIRKECAIN